MHGSKSDYGFRRPTTSFARAKILLKILLSFKISYNFEKTILKFYKISQKKHLKSNFKATNPSAYASIIRLFPFFQFFFFLEVQNCSTHFVTSSATASPSSSSSSSSEYKKKVKRLSSNPLSSSTSSSEPSTSTRKRSIFHEKPQFVVLLSVNFSIFFPKITKNVLGYIHFSHSVNSKY
eukprot:NP_496625.1 Uncharacterized protein CELE_Y57A10B.2 [Caenorhabditis elegans]